MATKKRKTVRNIILIVLAALVVAVAVIAVVKVVPFGSYDLLPDSETTLANGVFDYDIPLDRESPWPKFRANTLQTGRVPIVFRADPTKQPWECRTEKGIFSSPVVDKNGICYIGSADHNFYAINMDGSVKWKIETEEIIDSSALLDDQGKIYFASGDAKVYCANRETGELLWTYAAQTAQEVSEEFDIDVYNVNWFEGNVGILPDGDLLVPNDNYLLYRLDRQTGEAKQRYLANEMIWSLPSINIKTGNMFFGTIYSVLNNVLSYEVESGQQRWKTGGIGATAATTMLTSYKENGGVVVGSYDGQLRCVAQDSGKTLWKIGMRDHIYSSPAQLSDGTIIQPSADGTVYAINPENGEIRWAFDTLEPIRSSPAVDQDNIIYVGSGQGKLFAINSDGSLRWTYQCITEGRNDLNGSPALGYDGVYIAGESGQIFFVPYDYPLRAENANNPRCQNGSVGEDMPQDGGHLLYATPLGGLMQEPPESIAANQAITLHLLAREGGDTEIGQMKKKTLDVQIAGNSDFTVQLSADKRFMILIPKEEWVPDANGNLVIDIQAEYTVDPSRFGMLFFWGEKGGTATAKFTFKLNAQKPSTMPFAVPQNGQGEAALIEMRRQSIPNPSMLPSLNQIGFDSLHYLAGAVDTVADKTLFWVVGGKRAPDGTMVVDPETDVRFPLTLRYKDGLATFYNDQGFEINFVGSWEMPVESYRIAAEYDPATRLFGPIPSYNVTALCDEIAFYGPGLKLMGMSELRGGKMYTSGSLELQALQNVTAPERVGKVDMQVSKTAVTATLTDSGLQMKDHVYSLLVTQTDGTPKFLHYSQNTSIASDEDGTLQCVTLQLEKKETLEEEVLVYLLVDSYPVAKQTVSPP